MTSNGLLQVAFYLGALLACVKPLGWYMARVYQSQPCGLDRALGWLERGLYRLSGTKADAEMTWQQYAGAVLALLVAKGRRPRSPTGLHLFLLYPCVLGALCSCSAVTAEKAEEPEGAEV